MGLADAPDAQARLTGFIDDAVRARMPMSAFHYGSGYSTSGKRRYVFTWNRDKFPDPKARSSGSTSATCTSWPMSSLACWTTTRPMRRSRRAAHSSNDARTGAPCSDSSGTARARTWTSPSRKASAGGRRAWAAGPRLRHRRGLERQQRVRDPGRGWRVAGFGRRMPMQRSRPLHGLLMTRATARRRRRTARRAVFTVTRAGMPGIQRYAQTWSGDNTPAGTRCAGTSAWGCTMSLSGMFNIGP